MSPTFKEKQADVLNMSARTLGCSQELRNILNE